MNKTYSPEQQELIDLINDELTHFLVIQTDLVSNLTEDQITSNKLHEILEEQIDFAKRVGSAANIIGLKGLYVFCEHMKNNFMQMQKPSIDQQAIVDTQLLYWPEIIQSYLVAPNDTDYIQEVLNYLDNKNFPAPVNQQELTSIKEQFHASIVQVDESVRMQKATSAHVSLDVSDEISKDIFDNLMLDLPKQIGKLSNAVRGLNEENYLHKLEIATKIAHTIKGAVNIVGIQGIANITHCLEGIFEELLKAKVKPSDMLYGALQNATDCLEEMCEYLEGIGLLPNNSLNVYQDILNWANSINTYALTDQVTVNSKSTGEQHRAFSCDTEVENEYTSDLQLRVAEKLVDDLLNSTGEGVITSEQISELVLSLKSSIQNLITNNKNINLHAREIEHLVEIQKLHNRSDCIDKIAESNLIDISKLDFLQSSVNHLTETTEDSLEFSQDILGKLLSLEKHSNNLVRYQHESHETVLRVRMVPIQSIVPRLNRAVKQACKSSNKQAELKITGEETLVDSGIIHQLADPIMHILRNAIDHGIEAPNERLEKGKDPQGNIHLNFNVEGNSINVECEDDGCSLDLDLIRSKALARNLISENDDFDNENAIQMILRHGFSTKEKVSQLSGRGVGLAAVNEKIIEMKGAINIDASDANGINIGFSIPTNLNSVHALLIKCENTKVAISNRGVVEILHSGAGQIVSVSGQYYLEYLQHRYPVYDLRFMLEISQYNKPLNNKVTLIVNDDIGDNYAITIDKIYETRDIITKPISELVPNVSGLLGTTILGDGAITTVIDIVELIKHARDLENKITTSIKAKEQEPSKQYALVVEDSISVRKELAHFMQDLGFAVITAKDGVEALDQTKKHLPSIVLTDLEMPRMNGIELSKHLRLNKETAFTPIIMIASMSSKKDKRVAENSGITTYISKPYNEDELLEVINSLDLIEHVVV